MDSDDNCLVIDESTTDMEVSSTTPNRTAASVNGIETNKGNTNSEQIVPQAQTPTSELTPKQKERNGDKTKTKDKDKGNNKSKSTTPGKEKRRSLSNRSHWIRLTPAILKEKILNVSCDAIIGYYSEIFTQATNKHYLLNYELNKFRLPLRSINFTICSFR